jgi:NADH-quinone oxidoreductase subunit G
MYEMLLLRDGGSMSERIQHRNKAITVTIDGQECSGVYGETILEIARRNDLYIPTMCNLSKVSPIASCRMCVVNIKGVDGDILSCQEKAVDGIEVTTNNEHLETERTNIMKLYDVNHPLECGVCDKSGECDLQNKTLEFGIDTQTFSTRELSRESTKWGILGYNPSLCIMCEKCVHTCNEIIGTAALYIKPGGYKSTIDIKMSRCEQCGDCISVCPVGALVSNAYKYTSNAWEANKVPATCAHCPSACELEYDVKHAGTDKPFESKITRVKNNYEYGFLCGAGRFGFEFENKNKSNESQDFIEAVKAIKHAGTIKFNSFITNEEAFILQKLKETLNINLINHDAKNYQNFLNEYSSITGKTLYSATNETVTKSDLVIMIGTRISRDNPGVKYSVNIATKKQRAEFVYMHTVDDVALSNKYTQFVKYNAFSEEIVIAKLAQVLIQNIPENLKEKFVNIDLLNTNTTNEDFEYITKKLPRRKNKTLIIGSDLYAHKKSKNIAKIIAMIDLYTDFDVLLMPSQTNTLGVSLICDLDDEEKGSVVGYNEKADYTIASTGDCDFNVPALNQQEGTFTSINLKVVNTNAALSFDGFCLNDLVNEVLKVKTKYTIDYTKHLSIKPQYKNINFDDLKNGYDKYGTDIRGYSLNNSEINKTDLSLDSIESVSDNENIIIYRCEPLHQFNDATAKSLLLQSDEHLRGSEEFAKLADINAGDKVSIELNGTKRERKFKIDSNIKGSIALYPTFNNGLEEDNVAIDYRYKVVKIQKVDV